MLNNIISNYQTPTEFKLILISGYYDQCLVTGNTQSHGFTIFDFGLCITICTLITMYGYVGINFIYLYRFITLNVSNTFEKMLIYISAGKLFYIMGYFDTITMMLKLISPERLIFGDGVYNVIFKMFYFHFGMDLLWKPKYSAEIKIMYPIMVMGMSLPLHYPGRPLTQNTGFDEAIGIGLCFALVTMYMLCDVMYSRGCLELRKRTIVNELP